MPRDAPVTRALFPERSIATGKAVRILWSAARDHAPDVGSERLENRGGVLELDVHLSGAGERAGELRRREMRRVQSGLVHRVAVRAAAERRLPERWERLVQPGRHAILVSVVAHPRIERRRALFREAREHEQHPPDL